MNHLKPEDIINLSKLSALLGTSFKDAVIDGHSINDLNRSLNRAVAEYEHYSGSLAKRLEEYARDILEKEVKREKEKAN